MLVTGECRGVKYGPKEHGESVLRHGRLFRGKAIVFCFVLSKEQREHKDSYDCIKDRRRVDENRSVVRAIRAITSFDTGLPSFRVGVVPTLTYKGIPRNSTESVINLTTTMTTRSA